MQVHLPSSPRLTSDVLRAQQRAVLEMHEKLQADLQRVAEIDARETALDARELSIKAREHEHRVLNETLNRRATALGEQIRAHAERNT